MNLDLPVLLEDPVLCAIANKHKQTSALVALRYQIQRGVVVLAKSYNKKRIKENIQVMGGAVGRGLLRNILHESHSLSLKTFLESRQVTWSSPCMNVLCVFLVIFSSWCANRRGGMAGEGSVWTENRYFSFRVMSAIYSVISCKWHLIFFVLSWWNCIIWFFLDHLNCSNKISQIECLRKIEIYFSQFWSWRSESGFLCGQLRTLI